MNFFLFTFLLFTLLFCLSATAKEEKGSKEEKIPKEEDDHDSYEPPAKNIIHREKNGGALRTAPVRRGPLNPETEAGIRAHPVTKFLAFGAC